MAEEADNMVSAHYFLYPELKAIPEIAKAVVGSVVTHAIKFILLFTHLYPKRKKTR
jgi:hypothetical protein